MHLQIVLLEQTVSLPRLSVAEYLLQLSVLERCLDLLADAAAPGQLGDTTETEKRHAEAFYSAETPAAIADAREAVSVLRLFVRSNAS